MSVDRYDYIMVAVDLGPSAANYDDHEPELFGTPDRVCDIVMSGYDPEFTYAGKILAYSSDKYTGFSKPIILNPDIVDKEALAKNISELFKRDITPGQFKLIVCTVFN